LDPLYEEAIRDTIERFEATGSPVITDGEQRKYHNFWTYCVHGLPNTAPDGFKIPFAAGHVRRMLRLTGGPFRYKTYADSYLDVAMRYAHVPLKQALISPSALSLMYPADEIPGYSRDEFIQDLLHEHETESGSTAHLLRSGSANRWAMPTLSRLSDAMNDVSKNDLRECKAMLYSQAQALQAIFVNAALQVTDQGWLSKSEAFMRMALKAQNAL